MNITMVEVGDAGVNRGLAGEELNTTAGKATL
jgi:hypothetical protein